MNEESYIKELANEFELPVEQVALVWNTCSVCDEDFFNVFTIRLKIKYVRDVLKKLFPD